MKPAELLKEVYHWERKILQQEPANDTLTTSDYDVLESRLSTQNRIALKQLSERFDIRE